MRGVFLTAGQSAAHFAITAEELEQVVNEVQVKGQFDDEVEEFTMDKALWTRGVLGEMKCSKKSHHLSNRASLEGLAQLLLHLFPWMIEVTGVISD